MLSVQGDFPDGVVLSFWLSDGEAQVGSVRRPAGPGYSSASTQQEFRRASILSGKKQAVARRIRQTQSIRRPGSVVSLEIPQTRSEEHTSELQSQSNLVCRLLLETKKKQAS